MNTTSERKESETRNADLAAIGFALEIITGPYGDVDREDTLNWPHIAYKVRLVFDKREVLETVYKLGVGHVDITRPLTAMTDDEASMLRVWRKNTGAEFQDKMLQARVAAHFAKVQKVWPELDGVLQSLLLDGAAFFNAQSFEDWAGEFGYDKDSRKAEEIYKTCFETGRKISSMVSDEVIAKTQEIVRDL